MLVNKYTHRQIKAHFRVGLKASDDRGLGESRGGGRDERGSLFTHKFKDHLQSHSSSCCSPPSLTRLPPLIYHSPEKKYGRGEEGGAALPFWVCVCGSRCAYAWVWMGVCVFVCVCVCVCVIDCERIGQWEDCMWSIFMWHRFSGHVRTQQAKNDQTEERGVDGKHPDFFFWIRHQNWPKKMF